MVDKNSLRIGNILAWKDDESDNNLIRVSAICDDVVFVVMKLAGDDEETDCGYNAVRYVSLSPELLIKCGFEETGCMNADYTPIEWENDEFGYVYKDKDGVFYYELSRDDFGNMTDGVEIKHLHQLQNLYFALTQKELEVNL